MDRANAILKGIALATIPVVGVFLCIFLLQVSDAVRVQSNGLSAVIGQANAALTTVNAPCKDNGHQVVCGTLAEVSQTTKNIGILSAQGAEQVKQSGNLIQATTHNLDIVGASAQGSFIAITGAANSASTTIQAANTTIKAAQPLLDNSANFVLHLDTESKPVINQASLFFATANTLATSPDVIGILHGFNIGLATGDHMLDTADKVETKITKCTLYPDFKCVVSGLIVPSVQIGGAAAAAFRK
jgi:hypothetical protein